MAIVRNAANRLNSARRPYSSSVMNRVSSPTPTIAKKKIAIEELA